MANEQKRRGTLAPASSADENNAAMQQTRSRLDGLRAPERADMLDFSAVFAKIAAEQSTDDVVDPMGQLDEDEEVVESGPETLQQQKRPVRGRDLAGWLWQMIGAARRRPQLRLRGHIWHLLPIWMLVNLLLLIAVLAVMATQALPRSLLAFNSSCSVYTVSAGDTLYSISASYHLTPEVVAQANHLKSYGAITTGQQLCIPLGVATLVPADQAQVIVPNAATYGSAAQGPAAFILFALPYARSAHQQTGWPMSMILAQWALEHGWAIPTFTGYNWGNVGALPGVPLVASGGAVGAPPNFSYAVTPQDGVNFYVAVASLPYYSAVAPAGHKSANAAAQALGASPWDAGHYTGDNHPGDSLTTIMQDFDLYQYDTN